MGRAGQGEYAPPMTLPVQLQLCSIITIIQYRQELNSNVFIMGEW